MGRREPVSRQTVRQRVYYRIGRLGARRTQPVSPHLPAVASSPRCEISARPNRAGRPPLMIKLAFYGAAGEVTGSCYVLTSDHARVMIDMGMHQGEKVADEHNR